MGANEQKQLICSVSIEGREISSVQKGEEGEGEEGEGEEGGAREEGEVCDNIPILLVRNWSPHPLPL